MKRNVLFAIAVSLMMLAGVNASAQNLKAGETIKYTLSLGPIKAGSAKLSTKAVTYEGQKAYKVTLTANTGKAVDKIFSMRDTLESTVNAKMEPLYFHKHAFEGDDIVTEWAKFGRDGKKYTAQLEKIYKSGRIKDCDTICTKPIYDMVSMVLVARTMNASALKKGDRLSYAMADAAEVDDITLVFQGREKVKISGTTYPCLVFSLSQPAIEKGKQVDKELLRIFIKDDDTHIPVEIDFNLKFGTAKAKLAQ